MKRFLIVTAVSLLVYACEVPEVGERQSDTNNRVDSVLALMTLEEKAGQLNMYNGIGEYTGPSATNDSKQKAENIKSGRVGAMLNVLSAADTREYQELAVENSRLGIPLLFGYDVVHGYKTMMPVPIAQAASWDTEVARMAARTAAREAAASGVHWTFAPMIDVSRDARWGRIMEGAGEDPFLTAAMAQAWVKGYQGDDLSDPLTIAACAKHFAGYGFSQAGRDYNTVDISASTLYNVVLPPFEAAAEAGVATFMNSFNEHEGVPATGSIFLQREILKGKWEYEGFVVSDWGSIGEMITHGFARDSSDAAYKAISAGSDMDMESRIYEDELIKLVNEGKVKEDLLDDAVRRILKLKFDLGLFDDPYRYVSEKLEKEQLLSDENLQISRDAARKSMVLLKNEGNLLPLSKNLSSIAVIGQLAESKDVGLGNWRAHAEQNSAISLREGIHSAVGETTTVGFATGYTLTESEGDFVHELEFADDKGEGFDEALMIAAESDVVILALGENAFQTGEGRSQADISLKGKQLELFNKLAEVNENLVVVLMTGRPVAIPEIAEKAPAILEAWYGGTMAGDAIADVLFGDYNPSGKLPVSFPYHVGQEPLFYNRKNTGRPVTNEHDAGKVFWSHYTDVPNEAVFPFGFGLSYTTFTYGDISISETPAGVKITATVSNAGKVEGEEVVQLYMRDMVASQTRPIRELKGFKKVSLAPGEKLEVVFSLKKEDLSFYTSNGEQVYEPGAFQFWIGGSSEATMNDVIDLGGL